MPRLSALALRRPRAAIGLWLVVTCVLAAIGLGVHDRLVSTSLTVPGSQASHARSLLNGEFGDSATVPVMLTGPGRQVARQGRELAERLDRQRGVSVISPWAGSAPATTLRPDRHTMLLVASVSGPADKIHDRSAMVEHIARARVSPPAEVRVSGLPIIARAGVDASADAIRGAEMLALPLLLMILLVVFRSPLAAAIPVVFGAATVAASYGVLSMLTDRVQIDAFSTSLATMMGLALAVDYSLLMVARFREERRKGSDPAAAAATVSVRTGHTVLVAGLAVGASMCAAALLSPAPAVLSAALGVTAVTALSMAGASLAIPPALVLLAKRLPVGESSPHGRRRAWGRPLPAAVAAVGLAVLAVPSFGLATGAPGPNELPPGSTAREDAEEIAASMGAGWASGFEVVAVAERDPVTTDERLGAFARFERQLSRDPRVAAVMGPGSMAADAASLRRAGRRAVTPPDLGDQTARLDELGRGVDGTVAGVGSLQGSFSAAGSAAASIETGSGSVAGGVDALRDRVSSASGSAASLSSTLSGAKRAASAATSGAASARSGAASLSSAIQTAANGVESLAPMARTLASGLSSRRSSIDAAARAATSQRSALYAALDRIKASLPRSRLFGGAAAVAVENARSILNSTNVSTTLTSVSRQLSADAASAGGVATAAQGADLASLAAAAKQLSSGISSLESRLESLGVGVEDLAGGAGALTESLESLGAGAEALGAGVEELRGGAGSLVESVSEGEQRTSALVAGATDAQRAVDGLRAQAPTVNRGAAGQPAPGFFESGYFVLAALQSAGADRAGLGVNVDRGGRAARVMVIPRFGVEDPRTQALYKSLQERGDRFGRRTGTETAVGGPAAVLIDHDAAVNQSFPRLVIAMTLLVALLVAVLLRSFVVAAIGAVLNLLTVGATLGLLSLAFGGQNPLLGGAGDLDAVAVTAVFGVIFALSIDYQVFIVGRIREEFMSCGDARLAIDRGLARTARVVTGAALSMFGVFIAFAMTDIASVRQFGTGLAIAVVLDATVVRLVLLPAMLRRAGSRAWPRPATPARGAQEPAGARAATSLAASISS